MPSLGAARVAVGDDAVDDLDAGVGPRRDRTRDAEVDVVGMGHHDEDPFDSVDEQFVHHHLGRQAIAL